MALKRPLFTVKTLRNKMIVFGLLVMSIIGSITMRHDIVGAWELATTKRPEHYTALYFLDPGHMPTYAAVKKQQHLSFGITNHEGKTGTYQYIAELTSGGKTSMLNQGSVTIADAHSVTTPLRFTIEIPNTPATITIKLQGRAEKITFRTQS